MLTEPFVDNKMKYNMVRYISGPILLGSYTKSSSILFPLFSLLVFFFPPLLLFLPVIIIFALGFLFWTNVPASSHVLSCLIYLPCPRSPPLI